MFVYPGASQLVCQTQPIKVREGDDFMLRCQLDPPMDVSTRTSDWKRQDPDGFVHVYRNKQDLHADQMEAYRGRTTFDRGGLSEGILTLNISLAQLNDSGRYRCFIPSLGISCDMTVKVGENPEFDPELIILVSYCFYLHV